MSNRNGNAPTVRCAVYTRKSTEEGLDQEFNSLDAQREAGEAYIKSQQHEGWVCLPEHYDDGGFTGGNMDRPALVAGWAVQDRPAPTEPLQPAAGEFDMKHPPRRLVPAIGVNQAGGKDR
jgi:hypothetical protein